MNITPLPIRPGVRADVPRAFELICELATFENARDKVKTTPAQLERDGFDDAPLFHFLVAESGGEVVGMALCYFRYSTWSGKQLYLEDLIVTESARGSGVGKALLEATVQSARETGCTGLMWQVLDWNMPAQGFYEHFGARLDGEWINVHFDL